MSILRKSLSLALSVALAVSWAFSPAFEKTARAEDAYPSLQFESPATCRTEGGSVVNIPPGVYLPDATYKRLEQEFIDSQNQVTVLTAENKSLKDYEEPWPWAATAIALGVGVLAGRYVWGR